MLRREAEKVRQALQGTAGLVDLHVDLQQDIPEIRVTVNLEAAGKLGLKPGDVKRAAATIMYGMEVSDIHEGSKVYDVMVWSIPEKRNSLDDVRELLIDTPSGETVRLADVADVRIVPTPNAILREGFSRRIDVAADVRRRYLGSVSADVAARLATVEFPLGYRAEMLGEYQERQSAQRRMLWATFGKRYRDFLPSAGRPSQLGPGLSSLLGVTSSFNRRDFGRVYDGRDHLPWLSGRFPDRAWCGGTEWDLVDQPLPASGGTRGRSIWSGARSQGLAGAVCSDLDDHGLHRVGPVAIGGNR